MQKLTKFKVIFDLFTVCVYLIQQQIVNYITCSCDSAKNKAPADFSHHAILFFFFIVRKDPKIHRNDP